MVAETEDWHKDVLEGILSDEVAANRPEEHDKEARGDRIPLLDVYPCTMSRV